MPTPSTRRLVKAAILCALIYLSTLLALPAPTGYVHLGDACLLLAAMLLPPWWAAGAAAVGSCLADLTLGYALFIPGTFVIKACMALVAACIMQKRPRAWRVCLGCALGAAILPVGYWLYSMLVFDFAAATAEIWYNALQALVGGLVGCGLCLVALKRYDRLGPTRQ